MRSTVATSASAPGASVLTPSPRPFDRLVRTRLLNVSLGHFGANVDHIIVLDERHLTSVLAEFVRYYNEERPHRSLGLQTPAPRPRPTSGLIRSRPVLNGLHHVYELA